MIRIAKYMNKQETEFSEETATYSIQNAANTCKYRVLQTAATVHLSRARVARVARASCAGQLWEFAFSFYAWPSSPDETWKNCWNSRWNMHRNLPISLPIVDMSDNVCVCMVDLSDSSIHQFRMSAQLSSDLSNVGDIAVHRGLPVGLRALLVLDLVPRCFFRVQQGSYCHMSRIFNIHIP